MKYLFDSELDIIYFTGKIKKTTEQADEDNEEIIYVPFAALKNIDLSLVGKIQSKLCANKERKSIIVSIVDSNATIIYYEMTAGLLELNALDE